MDRPIMCLKTGLDILLYLPMTTILKNRDFWFSFNKGYTAVFHGNGGTVNGLDTWISEVDRDKDSTYPYKYTDVSFTPVRAGYQFEGWYLDENFSQKFYGFQDNRTYDTTGHADWKIPFWTTRSDYITDLYAKWSGGTEPEPSTAPLPAQHRCLVQHQRLVQHQHLPRHRSKV